MTSMLSARARGYGKRAAQLLDAAEMHAAGCRVWFIGDKGQAFEYPTMTPVGPRRAPAAPPRWWTDDATHARYYPASGRGELLSPTFVEAERAALDDPASTFARPEFRPGG